MIYWGILLECTKEGVTMPGHEKRVLSLDGLRGLGALMVFLLHVDIMVKPFGAGGGSESLPWHRVGHGVLHPVRHSALSCSL